MIHTIKRKRAGVEGSVGVAEQGVLYEKKNVAKMEKSIGIIKRGST